MSSIAEASAAASQPAAPQTPPAQTPPVQTPPATPSAPTPPPDPPAEKTAAQIASDKIRNVLTKPESKTADKDKKRDILEMPDEDFEKLRHNGKVDPAYWRRYDKLRDTAKQKESELQKRIAELEAKPHPTGADETKQKALEKQLEELQGTMKRQQQKLAEREYDETDEFKSLNDQWTEKYQQAFAFTKTLTVTGEDGAERPATEADFETIMRAPLQRRVELAEQLFGRGAAIEIIEMVRDLHQIAQQNIKGREKHSKNWESISKSRAEAQQKEAETYRRFVDDSRAALAHDFPESFDPAHYKDEPEMRAALDEGYKFVDDAESAAEKMPAPDRAATMSVIRARAAAFVLYYKKAEALQAQVKKLTEELEGKREKDPGNIGGKTGGGEAAPSVGSIKDMAAKFAT